MLYKRRSILQRLVLFINEWLTVTSPDPEQFQNEREARGLLKTVPNVSAFFWKFDLR